MQHAALSFESKVTGQGTYHFTLAKTGNDTGSLNVRETDDFGKVLSDNAYELTGVRAAGNRVVCQTSALFLSPQIEFTLSPSNMQPSISVVVTHAWFHNSSNNYAISPAAHWKIAQFIKDAAFPGA